MQDAPFTIPFLAQVAIPSAQASCNAWFLHCYHIYKHALAFSSIAHQLNQDIGNVVVDVMDLVSPEKAGGSPILTRADVTTVVIG
jgi:hypothetical protein